MMGSRFIILATALVAAVCGAEAFVLPPSAAAKRAGSSSPLSLTLGGEEVKDGSLTPLGDCVIVKVDKPKEKTSGGLFIPTAKSKPPTTGTVVKTGPGRRHRDTGVQFGMSVKEGQRVMWGKVDAAAVQIDGEDHYVLTESDLLFAFDGETVDLNNITMVGDRILVVLDRLINPEMASGVVVSADAMRLEKPRSTGAILAQGTGRVAPTGTPMPMQVQPGDMVKFRDYSVEFISREVLDVGEEQECGVIKSTDVIAKF